MKSAVTDKDEQELIAPEYADMIRQLEFKKAQLELGVRFQRNLDAFEKVWPWVTERFSDYTPAQLQLVLEDDGSLNLLNTADGQRVYPGDPRAYCRDQVDNYILEPSRTDLNVVKHQHKNTRYLHQRFTNALWDDYEALDVRAEYHPAAPIGLMLLIGCGIGHHIPALLERLDIHNLCIVDPHEDSFHASLHTIDWHEVLAYFGRKDRLLKFHIGNNELDVDQLLTPFASKIGLHNTIHTFVYRHFGSRAESRFSDGLKQFHRTALGVGFFDDERVSLAHSADKMSKGCRMFKPAGERAEALPPAIIVGNGPSLDKLLPALAEYGDRGVIFSAGTALGALCKAGIKPDFHVEMERVAATREWIELGTDAQFRKGITALGLNTAHPDVLALFDRAGYARKPNDLGSLLFEKRRVDYDSPQMDYCNPTVVNCALAYALNMGFREVHFLGVDLGKWEDGSHHSGFSLFADIEKHDRNGEFDHYKERKYGLQVPGNFTASVHTTPVMDMARVNMERLLKLFPVRAFNPNRGARIEGAEAVPDFAFSLPERHLDKRKLVDSLFEENFVDIAPDPDALDKISEEYLKRFFSLQWKLRLKERPAGVGEAVAELTRVYALVRRLEQEDPVSSHLLRGSLNMMFAQIYKKIIYLRDEDAFRRAWRIGLDHYHGFLEEAFASMKQDAFAWDDTPATNLSVLNGAGAAQGDSR